MRSQMEFGNEVNSRGINSPPRRGGEFAEGERGGGFCEARTIEEYRSSVYLDIPSNYQYLFNTQP
jgi:hypothetical protein